MDVAVMSRIAASPDATMQDVHRWGEDTKGFSNPLRVKALPTLTRPRAVALIAVLHGKEGPSSMRTKVVDRINVLKRTFLLDQMTSVGCSPANRPSGPAPWSMWAPSTNDALFDYLTRRRSTNGMFHMDADDFDDDGEGSALPAPKIPKVRYTDAQFSCFRRVQFGANISMKAMSGVIAGMHFGLAGLEGEPTTAHMIGERTLNSRYARLDYKDKQLEREELEAWVADNPVVRGSTTTDCTYMQGEMFVQHDAFAPRGEYKNRSPRTMFVGIGPVTGKSPTLCATVWSLSIARWLCLGLFFSPSSVVVVSITPLSVKCR